MAGVIQILRSIGAIPPHEFAYGAQLKELAELPAQVDRILSLECMDPAKSRVEVSILGQGSGLNALVSYLSRMREEKPEVDSLVMSLREITTAPEPARVAQLIRSLIQYRDLLNDEAKQEQVIIFVHFGLKSPSQLEPTVRETISERVRKLDTPRQFEVFVRGRCPKRYLTGNINIYPRLIENTSWYKLIDREDSPETQPILEVRFMGLAGVFEYLIQHMQKTLGLTFFHLDGEFLHAE